MKQTQTTEYKITDVRSGQEISDIIKKLDKKGERVTYKAIAEKLNRSLAYAYNRVVLINKTAKPEIKQKLKALPAGTEIKITNFAIEHSVSRWAVYLMLKKLLETGDIKKTGKKWFRK